MKAQHLFLLATLCVDASACKSRNDSAVRVIQGDHAAAKMFEATRLLNVGDYAICTGTFLSDRLLLTAGHCVVQGTETGMITVAGIRSQRAFYHPGSPNNTTQSPTDEHAKRDVALVVFPPGTGQRLGLQSFPKLAANDPAVGAKVWLLGYGLRDLDREEVDTLRQWGTNHIDAVQGGVISFRGARRGDPSRKTVDSSAAPGDSGGPLILQDATVAGVTSTIASNPVSITSNYASVNNSQTVATMSAARYCLPAPCVDYPFHHAELQNGKPFSPFEIKSRVTTGELITGLADAQGDLLLASEFVVWKFDSNGAARRFDIREVKAHSSELIVDIAAIGAEVFVLTDQTLFRLEDNDRTNPQVLARLQEPRNGEDWEQAERFMTSLKADKASGKLVYTSNRGVYVLDPQVPQQKETVVFYPRDNTATAGLPIIIRGAILLRGEPVFVSDRCFWTKPANQSHYSCQWDFKANSGDPSLQIRGISYLADHPEVDSGTTDPYILVMTNGRKLFQSKDGLAFSESPLTREHSQESVLNNATNLHGYFDRQADAYRIVLSSAETLRSVTYFKSYDEAKAAAGVQGGSAPGYKIDKEVKIPGHSAIRSLTGAEGKLFIVVGDRVLVSEDEGANFKLYRDFSKEQQEVLRVTAFEGYLEVVTKTQTLRFTVATGESTALNDAPPQASFSNMSNGMTVLATPNSVSVYDQNRQIIAKLSLSRQEPFVGLADVGGRIMVASSRGLYIHDGNQFSKVQQRPLGQAPFSAIYGSDDLLLVTTSNEFMASKDLGRTFFSRHVTWAGFGLTGVYADAQRIFLTSSTTIMSLLKSDLTEVSYPASLP